MRDPVMRGPAMRSPATWSAVAQRGDAWPGDAWPTNAPSKFPRTDGPGRCRGGQMQRVMVVARRVGDHECEPSDRLGHLW